LQVGHQLTKLETQAVARFSVDFRQNRLYLHVDYNSIVTDLMEEVKVKQLLMFPV
jgi:hypothetical protein